MLITSIKKREQFKQECKVINLDFEYKSCLTEEKHCIGNYRWAIITNLSLEELQAKYADIIQKYSPFVLLDELQGSAIIEHQNNEAKHRMRALRHGHIFSVDDEDFDEHHPEVATTDDIVEQLILQERVNRLREVLNNLSEIQKRRLIKHFFYGKNSYQIAKEEKVNRKAVEKSIALGIENIKKLF